MRRRALLGLCGSVWLAATSASADGGPNAADGRDGGAEAAAARSDTCVEHWPSSRPRPKLTESLPAQGISGHALRFEIVLEHGLGESVMPGGMKLLEGSTEAMALERQFFVVPDPEGGAAPRITTEATGQLAKTTLELFVVPLPPKPGRQELVLPPLPISLARASGELSTLCTSSHRVTIEDPIASTPDAKPKQNPDPRRQEEVWTSARNITLSALAALLVGLVLAWLLGRWLKRPKKAPPAAPPRPPWEVALEDLRDLQHQGLVERELFVDHFERVSFVLRRYCGDRYGFDGLECTTREMLGVLRRIVPPIPVLDEIETFLREADLVKFARLTPSADECNTALARAKTIVESTVPPAPVASAAAGGEA